MKNLKDILKIVIPSPVWIYLRRIWSKHNSPKFTPRWNTFSYEPMRGVKMYFDPTGPWQKKLLSNEYDNYIFERLKTLNLSGKTIFDVGAHIGFHSFYFSQLVGSKGKVYAFEPHPKNLERIDFQLKENLEAKPQ